ncbi:MAG: hypothetical protein LAP13_10850 [Acidobacteriia bacterium]|nr:hypothetical protein [Terriglobia bacterium]
MKWMLTTLVALTLTGPGVLLTQAAESVVVPPGSTLHVKLGTTITSKTNKAGDTFTGEVVQPVIANGKTVIPQGSTVNGHIAFLKPSGRIRGKAQMRVVLDSIITPDDQTVKLSSTLAGSHGGVCGNTANDEEGTIVGCGKSKKDAAKDAAIGGAMGAGAGATVGMGHEIDCAYFGNCGGPGMGTDVLAGAGIGAGTALLYNLFKHEKQIILVEGTELTFIVNRTLDASNTRQTKDTAQ